MYLIVRNLKWHIRYFISYHMVARRGDTEKYLTRGNLYHPRHTCITRDVVEDNTGVSRVIQVFEGQIIGNHVSRVIQVFEGQITLATM